MAFGQRKFRHWTGQKSISPAQSGLSRSRPEKPRLPAAAPCRSPTTALLGLPHSRQSIRPGLSTPSAPTNNASTTSGRRQDWNGNTTACATRYISYRLALIKSVHQVALEAGNSAQMVFRHYRQLVRESEAAEWFGIMPARQPGAGEIIPMPIAADTGGEASQRTEDKATLAAVTT